MIQKGILLLMTTLMVACATKDEAFIVNTYGEGTNLTGNTVVLKICSYNQKISIYSDGEESTNHVTYKFDVFVQSTNQFQKVSLPSDSGRIWWSDKFPGGSSKPATPSGPYKRSFQIRGESFNDYLLCVNPKTLDFILLPKTGTCPAGTTPQLEEPSC